MTTNEDFELEMKEVLKHHKTKKGTNHKVSTLSIQPFKTQISSFKTHDFTMKNNCTLNKLILIKMVND